jgi:FAD synthetase
MKPIPAVYIPVPSPFTTLEDFINHSTTTYNLDLFSCTGHSEPHVESVLPPASIDLNSRDKPVGKAKGEATTMREALQLYKDHFPRITAILVGTRRTDPHGCKFFIYQFSCPQKDILTTHSFWTQLIYPIEI